MLSQIMPISSTGVTVGFPIPTRNMDVFSRIMMSYSVFELYLCYFKLLFPLRVRVNGFNCLFNMDNFSNFEPFSVLSTVYNSGVNFPMDLLYGCSILIITLHCSYRSELELMFTRASSCSSYCFNKGSILFPFCN